MAPRNKNWPSIFKKSHYSSNNQNRHLGLIDEERNPQPRPRWNPKPEQIRILEGIFQSGTVSPTREEIAKIREQLQEFGEVGDASVFYWFQNRKTRSKRKRIPYNQKPVLTQQNSLPEIITQPPNSSSASSSDHQNVSPNEITVSENIGSSNINDGMVVLPNSPPVSLNQNQADDYFHTLAETDLLLPTPPIFSFPMENHINEGVVSNAMNSTPQDFDDDLSEFSDIIHLLDHENINNYGNENGICSMDDQYNQVNIQEETMNMMHMHQQDPQLSFGVTAASSNDDHSTDLAPFPPIEIHEPVDVPFLITDQLQGNHNQFLSGFGEEYGTGKCRVITDNDVFEVNAGLFNVREIFGDGAFLVDSSSSIPVLTDEWGVTLLHHGADYYLMYY